MKHTKRICAFASAMLLGCALFAGCGGNKEPVPSTKVDMPAFSGKQPSEYTWAEYLAMDESQQEAFRKSFGSEDVFEAWMEKAQREEVPEETEETVVIPWENGGKQPSEYTWAEFEALTGAQQMAFQNSFGSIDAFDAWLQKAQGRAGLEELPWENGGKQPSEYTWAEFEALPADQQMAFQNAFGSFEDFDAWLQKNEPGMSGSGQSELPWENGGKQPKDYTWEEFEALSSELQMAFQNSFESQADFDAWLEKSMSQQSTSVSDIPWENGGKQPSEYTWAEFEALPADLQIVFQNSFQSQAAFDAWMEKNLNQQTQSPSGIPWENGGKQPSEYTWAEFEALSGELQIAFQNSFDSFEDFEAWFQRVNP